METYRLNSRLVENGREYLIRTSNDVAMGSVSSEVFVDGVLADSVKLPHPEQTKPEEVLTFVESAHHEIKKEVEALLKAYREVMNSGNAEMMFHLALAFFYKRFYREARELLHAAVELSPDYHEAYHFLGQTELALGNHDDAVVAAETAVSKRPEYADYRNSLGEALMVCRSLTRAQKEFDRAIAINLYYSDAYFNYGLVTILLAMEADNVETKPNLLKKAHEFLTKAALTYPDYKTAGFSRGIEVMRRDDLKHAFGLLARVRDDKKLQYGHRHSMYHMQFALYPQLVTEKALSDRVAFLQDEIAKNPTYIDLHIELSLCYLEQARVAWKKGIDNYKKIMEINPSLHRLEAYIDNAESTLDVLSKTIQKISQRG